MGGNCEPAATFTLSNALFDRAGCLLSWDAGFEIEFAGAEGLITLGVTYRAVVEAAQHRTALYRTLDGQLADADVMKRHQDRFGAFGTPRSFLYRNPNDHIIRVEETVSARGDVFRVSEDVTEDWSAKRELAEAKKRLAAAGQAQPALPFGFTMGPDGRLDIPAPSAALKRFYGIPDDIQTPDAVGLLQHIEITAEERAAIGDEARRCMSTLDPLTFEYRVRDGDGNLRWIRASLVTRRRPDGGAVFEGGLRDITGEKVAQDQIELLRSVVVQSSDSVILMETSGARRTTVLYVNPAFERLYGITLGQLAGRNVADETFGKMDRAIMLELRRRRAEGNTDPIEVQIPGGDEPLWVEFRICKFQVRSDGSYSWATISRNITERKQAADELARNERMLAEAQRLAKIGTWEMDLSSGDLRWSDGIYYLLDLEPRSCLPNSELFLSFVHPDDIEIATGQTARMHAGNPFVTWGEFRIVRRDGTVRVIHSEAHQQTDEAGRVMRTLGTMQDITERKLAADELELSEHMLAEAERIARIGTWEVDLKSGRHRWSREMYRVFGLDPATSSPGAELLMALVHADDRDRVAERADRLLSGDEGGTSEEYRIVRPDGVERYLHGEVEYVKDGSGKVIRTRGTIQDITERKQAADELARSERMLVDAQRMAKIGNWEVDLESGETRWSRGLYSLLGLDPLSTSPTIDLFMSAIHPDDCGWTTQLAERILAGNDAPEFANYRILRPDGIERIIQAESVPVKDSRGKVTRVIGTLQDVTERKQAADELGRSERMLADAQRMAKIGNWEVDLQTGEIRWSRGLYEVAGLDPKNAPNIDQFLSVVHPDDRDMAAQQTERLFAVEEGVAVSDLRIIRPDGAERILHWENQLLKDPTGKPARLVGTVQDITERHQAADELARSERMLAEAQRVAKIGNWEADLQTGALRWSAGLYDLIGFDPQRQSPNVDLFISLIHPDDRAWAAQASELVLAGEVPAIGNYRIIRPDGVERTLHAEFVQVKDGSGKAARIIGTMQDVTERKLAADELARSEHMLTEAQRLAKIGTWEVDLASGDLRWSDGIYRLLGLEPGSCTPNSERFLSAVHSDDLEIATGATARMHAGNEFATSGEFRIVLPDGAERFIHSEVQLVKDEAGRITRTLGTMQDVTERKLAADELARSARMLVDAQRLARMGTWELDLPGGSLRWSEGLYHLLGLDPHSCLPSSERFLSAVHPDDVDVIAGTTESLFAGAEFVAVRDFRIVRPDGVARFIHSEVQLVKGATGDTARVLGSLQDITERKLADDELTRSERMLTEAQRIAQIGNWELDLLSGTLRWSDGLYDLIGLDPKSASPSIDLFMVAIHPDDRDRLARATNQVFAGADNFDLSSFRIIRPGGDERIIHGRFVSVKDGSGRATRVIGTVQDITEREQAADELARSERMLSEAQRIAKIGNWEADLQTGEVRWSRGLYDLIGHDPSSPPSIDLFMSVVHPDDRELAVSENVRIFATDEDHTMATRRIVRPDGAERYLHGEALLVRDTTGKPMRLVGTVQDITERKQAADELARSEHMLNEAQRMAKIGNWELDLASGELRWSDGVPLLLGLDPKEWPPSGEAFTSVVHPDDSEFLDNWAKRIYAADEEWAQGDFRIIRPDGAMRHLHAEIQFLKDGTTRALGTVQDITESRRAADELGRSERMLAEAQRIVKIGSWEANLQSGELRWSDGMYHLLGLPPQSAPPNADLFMTAVHPDDIEAADQASKHVFADGGQETVIDCRIIRPDGTERFIHAESLPVREQSGKVTRLVGTVQDVTLQSAAELELRNALELAKTADRAKSEFLANMSHELRTPLNAIIGFSELLMIDARKAAQSEKQEEYLRDIYNSGQHLLEIINGILSLSKIEAGRTVLEEELFDLPEIVDWTFRLLAEKAEGAGLFLEAEYEANLPRLFGDPRLVRQALLNLVSNATKFSNAGGRVRVLVKRNATGDLLITISDSGIGMTPDQVAIALTPFGQVESALQRKYEGTGLGLPLAKKFIELHGGELIIDSTPHEGTRVTIVMPRSRCSYVADTAATTWLKKRVVS